MTSSSKARIERFVDKFIRSEAMSYFQSERDSDFWNYPERAARVYDATESGADGKTHAEVIDDWRDAFDCMIRDRRRERPERFITAVQAYFDDVEQWHEANGTLWQEIG